MLVWAYDDSFQILALSVRLNYLSFIVELGKSGTNITRLSNLVEDFNSIKTYKWGLPLNINPFQGFAGG